MYDLFKETLYVRTMTEGRNEGLSLWARIEGVRDQAHSPFSSQALVRVGRKLFSLSETRAIAKNAGQSQSSSTECPIAQTTGSKPAA